jgi:bacterioferritin (cytochrome b1)
MSLIPTEYQTGYNQGYRDAKEELESQLAAEREKIDKLKSALKTLEASNRPPSMKAINEILK